MNRRERKEHKGKRRKGFKNQNPLRSLRSLEVKKIFLIPGARSLCGYDLDSVAG